MRKLSDINGSASESETSWEIRDIRESHAGTNFYKALINKANTVPLQTVFTWYKVPINKNNKRAIICPFKSHQGGRESSGSFYFYPDTNTFWCFGCKTGTKPCDFVAAMDNCTKVKAAYKICDNFSSYVEDENLVIGESFGDRLKIMSEFSTAVRNFRLLYKDENSSLFIENICKIYDQLNEKHELSNEALSFSTEKLIGLIVKYSP
jgi:hypothetical protein